MNPLLEDLLQDARLWQGYRQNSRTWSEPTGHDALDRILGGWPRGALSECLLDTPGIGELRLVLPLLRQMTGRNQNLFWINPPCTPYAPALARSGVDLDRLFLVNPRDHQDSLWAQENCLRSASTGAVLAWPGKLRSRDIRRLQLAAEAGSGLCLLFRARRFADHSSPAALRLELTPGPEDTLQVHILKRRGGWPGQKVTLTLDRLPEQPFPPSPEVVRGPWPALQPAPR